MKRLLIAVVILAAFAAGQLAPAPGLMASGLNEIGSFRTPEMCHWRGGVEIVEGTHEVVGRLTVVDCWATIELADGYKLQFLRPEEVR